MTQYSVKITGQLKHQTFDTYEQVQVALMELARQYGNGSIRSGRRAAIFVDHDNGMGWERVETHDLAALAGLARRLDA